jgi:hypothetical protein
LGTLWRKERRRCREKKEKRKGLRAKKGRIKNIKPFPKSKFFYT